MRPLEGLTVVALEQAVAAPLATRHLADLGARVIKIERPVVGDFARAYDRTVRGLASHFVWLNRSKESLTLDLKRSAARDVLARLVAGADVFVQNLAPGAAARLGLDAGELRRRHPRLIVCDISGYGSQGPYRDKKAYDLLVLTDDASFTQSREAVVDTHQVDTGRGGASSQRRAALIGADQRDQRGSASEGDDIGGRVRSAAKYPSNRRHPKHWYRGLG